MSFQEVWQFVLDKPAVASFILAAAAAVIGGIWALCWKLFARQVRYQAQQENSNGNDNVQTGQAVGSVTIHKGADASVDTIVKTLVETLQEGHRVQLREIMEYWGLRDQMRMVAKIIQAEISQQSTNGATLSLGDAHALLEQGKQQDAEDLFEKIRAQRIALIQEARKEAAAAAYQIGELAFNNDTDKAISAFRNVVMVEPDNADAWTQLGHLLRRKGEFDAAEEAYERVLSLANGTT